MASVEQFFSATFLHVLTYIPRPIRAGYLRLVLSSLEGIITCATGVRVGLTALSTSAMRRRLTAQAYRFERGPLRPLYIIYWLSRRVSNRWTYIAAHIALAIERRLKNAHHRLTWLIERGSAQGFTLQYLREQRQLTLASWRGHLETYRFICDEYIASGNIEYLIPLSELYLKWGQVKRAFDILCTIVQLGARMSVGSRLDAAEMFLQLATIDNALLIDERSKAGKPTSHSQLQRLLDFKDPLKIAFSICQSVLAGGPNGRALRLRAEANYLLGHNVAAAEDMAKAAKFSRLSAKEYMIWVNALRRSGKKDEAIRVLTLAELNVPDLTCGLLLGRMLIDANCWTEGTSRLVHHLRKATRALDQ